MSIKSDINKKKLLEALDKTMCVVTKACELCGVSRMDYYYYLRTDAEFKKQVEELKNIRLDFAEDALTECIESGNITAIMYYLNNKGKERGYSRNPKPEVDTNRVNINISGMNADAI